MPEFRVSIDVNPLPKQRPRLGKGGNVYTPTKTKAYEDKIAWECRAAMLEQGIDTYEGDIAISITFYRADKIRVDIDNLTKAVLDACNGVLWQDDSQILALDVRLHRASLIGRVDISVMTIVEHDAYFDTYHTGLVLDTNIYGGD